MARYRLSRDARDDIATLLTTSAARWGRVHAREYRMLIAAAMREAARTPTSALTRERGDVFAELRSLHVRHARRHVPQLRIASPVHVIFYRAAGPDLIEIVGVLHERMEPAQLRLRARDQT